MAQHSSLTDQRRFSSILIVHPHLKSPEDLVEMMRGRLRLDPQVKAGGPDWAVTRAKYFAARSHYPASVIPPESIEEHSGYAHEIYLGSISATAGPGFVLIASPYVRLLQQLVGYLARSRPEPALQYLAVDMRRTYAELQQDQARIAVTRVTLQMLNQPGLELVALTGRNPLNSELHASIEQVTAPYAVRVEVTGTSGDKSRVNVDRHGNVWWYQTDETRLEAPLGLIEALANANAFHLTRSLPLDRAKNDDDAA